MNAVRTTDINGNRERLAQGGLGVVYRLHGYRLPDFSGDLAYKEFLRPQKEVDVEPVRRLIELRSTLDATRMDTLDRHFAWPLREVVDGSGATVGILMPLLPRQYRLKVVLQHRTAEKDAQLDFLFRACPSGAKGAGAMYVCPADDDVASRIGICRSMAIAFELLDELGLVYGDFSQKNALWSSQPVLHAFVIDCDAIRFESDPDRVQANTSTWFAPESLQAAGLRQTRQTDRYKLALFILRCLAPGGVGLQKTDPELADSALDVTGQDLLKRGLGDNPDERPDAATWHRYLSNYLVELTSPPTIDSITVDRHTVLLGDSISARWVARGAELVTIVWPDGHSEVHTAGLDPGCSTRPLLVPGRITVRAENKFGHLEVHSGDLRPVKPPEVERIVIPVPGMENLPPETWLILRNIFDRLADATSATRAVEVALPDLRGLTQSREPIQLPALPSIEALTKAPDMLGSHHFRLTMPGIEVQIPSIHIDAPRIDLPQTDVCCTHRRSRRHWLRRRLRRSQP